MFLVPRMMSASIMMTVSIQYQPAPQPSPRLRPSSSNVAVPFSVAAYPSIDRFSADAFPDVMAEPPPPRYCSAELIREHKILFVLSMMPECPAAIEKTGT